MLNPSFEYFRHVEADIERTRRKLVSDVSQYSPALSLGAESLVSKRLRNAKVPVLGELVPWLLSDLFGLRTEEVQEIATAWLKVYLYTCFIDDALDESKRLNPNETLSSSILFQEGSATLFNFVRNTKYETLLRRSFYLSAEGELLDIEERSSISTDKTISAKKKNYVFLACAAALAAQAHNNGQAIIEFSEAILLGLQYLDDIADWDKDYSHENYTRLLSSAMNRSALNKEEITRNELLKILVRSGSLGVLLQETREIIERGILIALPNKRADGSAANVFLRTLFVLIRFAEAEVLNANERMQLPGCDYAAVLDRVEKALIKIAQSS
ncbi:MAG: hypothetical protein ACR2LR_24580 [Hassallia sp.]